MYLASTLKSNQELLEKMIDEEEEFKNRKIQLEKDIELGEIQQKIMEQSGTIVKLKTQILKLSENILAFGNPGSGKTHLLCAIGHALIESGKQVLFITCGQLVQDLLLLKESL